MSNNENEKKKLISQNPTVLKPDKTASFLDLFHFSSSQDKAYSTIAAIFSLTQGLAFPFMSILFGDMVNNFAPDQDPVDATLKTTLLFIYLGIAVLLLSFVASFLWSVTANSQVKRLKVDYFKRLVGQNCVWYDRQKIETLSNNFVEHTTAFEIIFSGNLHILFMSVGMIFGGFIVGFIRGWFFTICIIALTPLMLFGMFLFFSYEMKGVKIKDGAYSQAGAITDQAFVFIKNVKSLNGEEHEISKFDKACKIAEKGSISFGWKSSFFYGVFFFCILVMYSLSFLIGSRLIANDWYNHNVGRNYNVGDILAIFFGVITGIFAFAQIGPIAKSIQAGRNAISMIFKITSENMIETSGNLKSDFKGEIQFKNVSFAYPSKPDIMVLKNLNLNIKTGQKVALVGPSGCGKSTVIQLLQRYYDPVEGEILLDGINLKEYDLKFLRSKVGLVAQQPILFADTIKNNIIMGVENIKNITDNDIDESLKKANAFNFVQKFDKKKDEYVGSLGGQLSGGQKQRIAIARAIIREPRLYLFDEATSALDRKNEMEIQQTIDSISKGQTSITIAHRLITVKNSDVLFLLKNGEIVEKGNHENLMQIKNGFYKELVEGQILDVEQYENENEKENKIEKSDTLDKQPSLQPDFSMVSQNEEEKKKNKIKLPSLFTFLGNEKYLILPGLIMALLNGAVMPLFGWALANVLGVLNKFVLVDDPSSGFTKDEIIDETDKYVIWFFCLALLSLFANFLQLGIFNFIGEKFTYTLRSKYFRRLMYKDMEYFDKEGNEPGNLSATLSKECRIINVLIGNYLGAIIMSLCSFIVGVIIAFIASWRMALVAIAMSPFLVLSGVVESSGMKNKEDNKKIDNNELNESLNNIKMVKSLNGEEQLLNKFSKKAEIYRKKKIKGAICSSTLLAFSQFIQFVVYGLLFYVGAIFVRDNGLSFTNLMIAMFGLMFGAYGAGMANQFMGNIGAAQASSKRVLTEITEFSKIEIDPKNPPLNTQSTLKPNLTGRVEFKNVYFRYKGRKNWVLNNLNFVIEKNQSHALVGSSGCGKSTIMQLFLRFYDIQKGQILFDDFDIRTIDIKHLRSIFGRVSQEPSLFNGTIEYNIKYNREIENKNVEESCLKANAMEFINKTDDKFKYNVGNRGEKLSGGQKQRIAIARCLVRKPNIFLFDEATSALDNLSEEIVQKAIEEISKGTTSVTIAHRISTIQNCDKIFVVDKGKIVEKGNYQNLMNKGGMFFELAKQ